MRRFLLLSMVVLLAFALLTFASAEEQDKWTCPSCATENTGNFCSNCGAKKPQEGKWTCPSCGADNEGNFCSNCGAKRSENEATTIEPEGSIRLDLKIGFEKNSYFSTYDVKLFIDDEWITTIRHGVNYFGTVYVTPGKHIILFQEDGSYPAEGSAIVKVEGDSCYSCELHATMSAVQITGEKLEAITMDRAISQEQIEIAIDGNIRLNVYVEFQKNAMFSTYDVDMYLDDVYVATLRHGKDFDGTLLVSKGKHMLSFYRSGKKSIRGTSTFTVDGDASFSCRINAENNKVRVSKEKMK